MRSGPSKCVPYSYLDFAFAIDTAAKFIYSSMNAELAPEVSSPSRCRLSETETDASL
jgi:hypothetical protein